MNKIDMLRQALHYKNLEQLLRPERRADFIIVASLIILILLQFLIVRKFLLKVFAPNTKLYNMSYSSKVNFILVFIYWIIAITIINAHFR